MKNNILLVDDDEQFALTLQAYLDAVGFRITVRASAEEGLLEIRRSNYDLLLLDLSLPGEDSLCLIREVKNQKDLPIIIIIGRLGDESRIAALELGADDYIAKPFSPKELSLRIKKRLSIENNIIANSNIQNKIKFGSWTLDKNSWSVVSDEGKELELTPREFDVLSILAAHKGHVMSREFLIDASLQVNIPDSNRAIDITISRLRSKLEMDASSPTLIKTIKGRGYKLVDDR